MYSGSLLNFNHHSDDGSFVIASGAILGIGASLLWVVQGAIMTTYVNESQKGRAIAVFWIIFNLGGGVGALASFGLNFHSSSGTVGDSTYIALMVIMLVGWGLGLFICSPLRIRLAQLHAAVEKEKQSLKGTIATAVNVMFRWRVILMLPLFFCANVFYSYPAEQRQRLHLQHSHTIAQLCIILDGSDARRSINRIHHGSALLHTPKKHKSEDRLGCALRHWHGYLGWRVCLPKMAG